MTNLQPLSKEESWICSHCGLPIGQGEIGILHFGTHTAHAESRCLYLLKAERDRALLTIDELERERDKFNEWMKRDSVLSAVLEERDEAQREIARLREALESLTNAVNADQSQLDKCSNFDRAYSKAMAALHPTPEPEQAKA